jgi:hypothetical protein
MSDRHECECRYWLRITKGNRKEVDDLMVRIARAQGQAAADRLRQGMREMYRREKDGK